MPILLATDSLPAAVETTERRALACGALQPIDTVQEAIEDGGVRFLVRRVSSLARKDRERVAAPRANPFLPPEPELVVAEVSDTHVAVLNKFNVLERHLLIVTREFVHQERLPDEADFAALAACMAQWDGLAFYNGGEVAGASQPHKHLQLVPLPLSPDGPAVPMDALLREAPVSAGTVRAPGLPFAHAFARIDEAAFADPAAAAPRLLERCRALLHAIGIGEAWQGGETRQSGPYNLLVTRRWMLAVPRSRERCEGISVNALGYAGSLFARDDAQMAIIRAAGPMAVLSAVSLPAE